MTSYLFLEVAVVLFAMLVTMGRVRWSFLATRWFVTRAAVLGVFWLAVDQVALGLGLWAFPEGGSLPFRLLGLPVEEYALFVMSSVVCAVIVQFFLLEES